MLLSEQLKEFTMGPFSFTELLVVLAVIILLFGSKRIPELAKGLGGGIRGFKDAMQGKDEAKDIQK
jgi:sec-independent protein translocase protein TatA